MAVLLPLRQLQWSTVRKLLNMPPLADCLSLNQHGFASEIFWLAISFGILYFVFSKKTLPNISGIIENRKNHIQADLETAEKLTAEADNVHAAYQSSLEKAQSDSAIALLETESEIKEKAAQAFDAFRLRSEKEIQAVEKTYFDGKIKSNG